MTGALFFLGSVVEMFWVKDVGHKMKCLELRTLCFGFADFRTSPAKKQRNTHHLPKSKSVLGRPP